MAKLTITAKQDGFRRAGRAWSKEPTEVDSGEFSKEELEALKHEPMLVVETGGKSRSGKSAEA